MSELIDTDKKYCDVEDVEDYLRKKFSTDATDIINEDRIKNKIKENSNKIDKETGKAWRTRETTNNVKAILTKAQEEVLNSGRIRHQREIITRDILDDYSQWVTVYLKRSYVQSIESIKYARESDIYNLESSEYRIIDEKNGKVQIELDVFSNLFKRSGTMGQVVSPEYIYIKFKYGKDNIGESYTDIKKACAMYTAADFIESDFNGRQLSDNSDVSLDSLSNSLREQADDIVENHKR